MNKTTKIFIVLFVILISVLVYGWWYNRSYITKPSTIEIPRVASSTQEAYTNKTYGFTLDLPLAWKGYTASEATSTYGFIINIRNPMWTPEAPRMDIPILVYPLSQWEIWETNNFEGYPTAAPIPPTERGRNTKYVFATAPRYNFEFLPGFEEVDTIVQTLKGIE